MKKVSVNVILAVLLVLPNRLCAQGLEEVSKELLKIGVTGVLAVPVGEFSDFVDVGGGINLSALVNFDRRGLLGLRFDGSFLMYGHERTSWPLSNTIQRVWVDVHTNNLISSFGVGPQLTLGTGPVRPYAFGLVGFSYFATVSSVEGTANVGPFASSTNFDDFTFMGSGGAGLLIALSRGDKPISLDLSVQTLRNGRTEYLRPGSIHERADGSVFITPIESEANLVTVKAGVSIGVM